MSFRFVNIVGPDQGISAESRSHVMRDYIRRKRATVDQSSKLSLTSENNRTQSRATKMKAWKRTSPSYPTSLERHEASCAVNVTKLSRVTEQLPSCFGDIVCNNPELSTSISNSHRRYHDAIRVLEGSFHTVQASSATLNGTIQSYLVEMMADFHLSPQRCIGSEIDPFHTLPQLSDSSINIERLKKHCSVYFGSEALGRLWVPTILKSRHSFLSCMCLGASHYDIMNGFQREGTTTLALKVAVIQEINESISVSCSEINQSTVISILHLLAAEAVNGDEFTLRSHLAGLGLILDRWGGLSALGLDGLIANILSMIVYIVWIVRGFMPPNHFLDPFLYSYRLPFTNTDKVPESPLYAPRLGFFTIIGNKRCTPQLYDLLCDMREFINGFVDVQLIGPRQSNDSFGKTKNSIFSRLMKLPSASILNTAVSDDWVYESCRLAAQVHYRQLCMPFATDIVEISSRISVIHELQSALNKSDISDCWDDMAAALFWCSLVGANGMYDAIQRLDTFFLPNQSKVKEMDLQKHEHCWKWLTLLVVRIGVVLGFQYPEAICITLRRFIHVRVEALNFFKSPS